jgi:hypothetical protein
MPTPANRIAHTAAIGSRFAHMGPADAAVWERYLMSSHPHFVSLEYDVRLGGQTGTVTDAGGDMRDMWEALVKKRVDVIARTTTERWIVEVKPTASMAALGQALSYLWLWENERGDDVPTRAVVVASKVDEDLVPIYSAFGVWVVLAPPRWSEPSAEPLVLAPARPANEERPP